MIGPRSAVLTQVVAVLLVALGVAWFTLGTRSVLDVGGACATGGPYVSRVECPDGTGLVFAGFPVAMVTAMVGGIVVKGSGAPSPLLLAWVALFGAGGWNFLDSGQVFTGVLFWVMALPVAAYLVAPRRVKKYVVALPDPEPGTGLPAWWALTLVSGAAGAALGALSFAALT
ncbi:hypothetical protein [Nocardioides sp. BYT-33-1]|uniref:hypothetical protein n=1 Tax=Nocardioides sp. BYT-33-1 TaxID=3416952 RepID=UPI003F5384DC